MFNRSHNFTISGGNFNNAGRDLNLNIYEERGERGLSTLHRYTTTTASFDAEARYPPPLCHPGTRDAILRDLESWASSTAESDNFRVCWLHGPAGAGKSAIAQTFAQTCAGNGSLLGSFFFWRSDPSRNNPQHLIATIALQMAIAIPDLRAAVDAAVIHNPFTPTSSIETQCEDLIFMPWLKSQVHRELRNRRNRKESSRASPESSGGVLSEGYSKSSSATGARVLIVDGLDECSSSHNQERILLILAKMVEKLYPPIRILVCSRPEPRIKESFKGPRFKAICRWIPLDDTYQASKDILLFLEDGFRKILERHSHSMDHVPRPWPTFQQIEYLVQKSSGQFIYASTVLKYIDDDGDVPADRLDVILGLQAYEGTDSPFAELDALYIQILSTVKKKNLLLQVLAARIAFESGWKDINFVDFLDIPVGILHAMSFGIHALFQGPSPVDSGFEFSHASFPDFLLDCNRSLQFHVDESGGHDFLARRCLELYKHLPLYSNYILSEWAYHCAYASGTEDLLLKLNSFPVYTAITEATAKYAMLKPEWTSDLATLLGYVFRIWRKFQVSLSFSWKIVNG
ncbi:hypothetical protein GYMLUDRAFT_44069 [Collybiopsis luxurians FD-317 M1]|uniref:Nephrocystin 3-like N-terminal domain-containing protein n=1 Tax=Collybiopsis luxurians FD-317 M1 TaxID=944289 RepID=A0A0D0CVN7_9AGAR|nr:hypothetical protein GYMLUDRAFT_44069 [Collybiopsis luxurians FD-317 M1]